MTRILLVFLSTLLSACHSDIYVRDGVTSGSRFHLSPAQLLSDDPVEQSWVAYSLSKSVCQLELGGPDPAHANSYGCELSARMSLLKEWAVQRNNKPVPTDQYLDTLMIVQQEAFLDEYVVHYFGDKDWQIPAEVDTHGFDQWRRRHLAGHKPYSRIVGSWTYPKHRDFEETE